MCPSTTLFFLVRKKLEVFGARFATFDHICLSLAASSPCCTSAAVKLALLLRLRTIQSKRKLPRIDETQNGLSTVSEVAPLKLPDDPGLRTGELVKTIQNNLH